MLLERDESLTNGEKFREYDYSYDSNGNIEALKRNNGNRIRESD